MNSFRDLNLILFVCLVAMSGCRRYAAGPSNAVGAMQRSPFRGVPAGNLTRECVADFNPATDYFPDRSMATILTEMGHFKRQPSR